MSKTKNIVVSMDMDMNITKINLLVIYLHKQDVSSSASQHPTGNPSGRCRNYMLGASRASLAGIGSAS
jgi:hypothetical protein